MSRCSDSDNIGLHNISGLVDISKYTGNNLIMKHGPIKVGKNKQYFEYLDSTPFFWPTVPRGLDSLVDTSSLNYLK